MKKKVVYLTQWVAKDSQKQYPHGYGFIAPIVEFPQDMDAAECANACRELSNDEFECIGATPIPFIDGGFEILGILPTEDVSTPTPIRKREDAGLPIYDPINLSKKELIKAAQTAIGSQKEYEQHCQRLEKALSICHDLLRDVDIYADQPEQSRWSVHNCSKIANDGLNKLYREFPDLFLKGIHNEGDTIKPVTETIEVWKEIDVKDEAFPPEDHAYLCTMGGQAIGVVKKVHLSIPVSGGDLKNDYEASDNKSNVTPVATLGSSSSNSIEQILKEATIYGRPISDLLLPDQIERLAEQIKNNLK